MTLTDEALKLIADRGPMRFKDVQTATGWPAKRCKWVLQYLVERRFDLQRNNGFFELADGNNYTKLPDVQELATQGLPGHGTPGICQVCARPGLGLPAADADVQAVCARGCSEGCAAGQVGCAGVKA